MVARNKGMHQDLCPHSNIPVPLDIVFAYKQGKFLQWIKHFRIWDVKTLQSKFWPGLQSFEVLTGTRGPTHFQYDSDSCLTSCWQELKARCWQESSGHLS